MGSAWLQTCVLFFLLLGLRVPRMSTWHLLFHAPGHNSKDTHVEAEGLDHLDHPSKAASSLFLKINYIYFFFFWLFRAALAYGGSQARDPIEAVATGLHHSHCNAGFLTH